MFGNGWFNYNKILHQVWLIKRLYVYTYRDVRMWDYNSSKNLMRYPS